MSFDLLYALWRRDLVKWLRDRQSLVSSLSRPLLWLLALGFGLRGSFRASTSGVDYVTFLVPGIAAMSVLFSSMFAAISIVWDREFGFLKELLVAPVPRTAVVVAKMAAAATMSLLEALVVLLIAPLFGARFDPLGAAAALGLLAVFGMAVNALGIGVAAGMKTFEGFGSIVNFVLQPIFFLSGAMYPLDAAPPVLRTIVLANPMSYAVDAARGLMLGVHHNPLWLDAAVVVGATAVLTAWATHRFARMQA